MNSPYQESSHPELVAFIAAEISSHGGIPFADFMRHCLYHPQYGYYMTTRQRIGRGGDFFTSSSVHALFGRLLARQLHDMWHHLGQPEDFSIVEQGAGEGYLCLDILDALQDETPDFYRTLTYRLVEISPENRRRQQLLLERHAARVCWCDAAELDSLVGCILSNELVDAFPVHLVEKQGGRWYEVYVVCHDGELAEELRPLAESELTRHFAWLGYSPAEGNRAEVNLEAVRWMKTAAAWLARGFVLTIDYGYPAQELYAAWRRSGTLMCYARHATSENPYERIGVQDITAHVDFTALTRTAEEAGLTTLYFAEQYRFLMGLGFVEAVMAAEAREQDAKRAQALRLTLKNLILPEGGMGEMFKVLIQGKGVGTPVLLCAQRIQDLPVPRCG